MSLALPPLPYPIDALEPHLSRRTLGIHHGQHHAAYLEKVRGYHTTAAYQKAMGKRKV